MSGTAQRGLLLDITPLDDAARDAVVSHFAKSLAGQDSRIWTPLSDPASAALVESYYAWGRDRLEAAMQQLVERLGRPRRRWFFAKATPADGVFDTSVDEWTQIVDRIIAAQFSDAAGRQASEAAAIRAYLLGRVQDALAGAGTLRDRFGALPTTLDGAMGLGGLTEADKRTMEYLRARAAVNVQGVSDGLRAGIKRTIIDAHEQRLTPAQTERKLFDQFSDANRDMRKIAITEASEGRGQGTIAAQPEGAVLVRHEAADACSYCRAIDGKEYRVVPADKPDKDWQREVWVGKTNIGRSRHPVDRLGRKRPADELWAPCACVHPHCRGIFKPKLSRPAWLRPAGVP